MYIDTHSRESMEKSICNIFQMHQLELREQLLLMGSMSGDNDYINKLDEFKLNNCTKYPEEILLFHLTRRLHGTEDETKGCNRADLLLSVNPFSSFMHENGIDFSRDKQHINVIYKGKTVDWDKCWHGNPSYMKIRLGYFKGREDFGFNGFALKDLLYRNHYARDLSMLPEFLGQMVECLDCESVGWKYIKNSQYYCYEYKLPIEVVMFDDHDNYSDTLKQRYLLRCILQRLYQYQTSNISYMYDHDNPALRLADDYTVPSEYYVGKEKITSEMLSY